MEKSSETARHRSMFTSTYLVARMLYSQQQRVRKYKDGPADSSSVFVPPNEFETGGYVHGTCWKSTATSFRVPCILSYVAYPSDKWSIIEQRALHCSMGDAYRETARASHPI